MISKTEWIQKISADDPDYWNRETDKQQDEQDTFKSHLSSVMKSFNQTEGVHTLQRMYGCELHDDGTTRGYFLDGFNGEDFIGLDLNTGSWTADEPQAEIIKNVWESTGQEAIYWKNYLETVLTFFTENASEDNYKVINHDNTVVRCIPKVRPEVSLIPEYYFSPGVVCHATGFFPKEVMISWRKDGEDVYEYVELRKTLPNQDGSFQKRSILKVPAEELQKHNYTCVIQHSSLEEELVLPVGTMEPEIIECVDENVSAFFPGGSIFVQGPILVIIAIVVALVVLVAVVAGIMVWKKKTLETPGDGD
ncbi:hypothetical protein QTP70_014450, partial [Hemibagrus guttatus]